MSTDVPKSEEFYQLICRASRLLRRHALLIGGTLVALLAVGWLTAAVAVDLLIPLATTFRLLFAVGFWLVLATSVAGLLVWPALRRLTLEDVALRIERTVGGMHNRLLTVLDFHRTDAAGKKQSSPEMVARLMWQTRGKLADFRIRQILNPIPLLRSLVGLVAVLVLAVILAVVFRESAPTALARILRPTADIPPVTWLRIAAPGELTAPAGDPLTIGVDVTRGEVDDLSLHLQQPDGKWVVYPMQRDGEQRFAYTLSGVMADYRYKVSGGGTWTSEYQIRMVPRPTIDAVTASIRLPRYMQHTEPLPVADDVRRIEAPIDAHLMLAAAVSGDVARGEVVLLKRSVEIHDEVQDEEHVWFEDDLPADAETVAPWRWSTARTFTGLKSFTFDRTHQPFGFITRLSPLHVPAPGLFYLMVWLDAADPPGRITLRLRQDNLTRAFDWGEKSTPAAGQPPAVHLGSLPQPTRWVRLEVPADVLGAVPTGVKLLGMSLEIDRGQVFFDRPGYLIRSSRPVEKVRMETIDTLPMQRDEASGRWLGDVPVAVDRLLTVRFHSALGQASADREPLELIATKDQPPSIVVEKPGLDVVLAAVQPLPISARALDDWGIAAVGIQLGPAENTLSAVRWQPSDAALVTARNINMSIDSQAEHLAPNQTLCYRLVAKDCNGQTTESKIYKLAIAAPDRAGAPETAKAPESLEQLLKMVAQMAQAPRKDRESAEFVAGLPVALRGLVDSQGVFRKNDGSLLPAEELRKLIEQGESQLTPEQKQRLAELTAELDRRQQELKQLAEMLKQAAQKSAASPLALQQDSKLLTRFATQAQAMAADLNPTTVTQGPPAPLERELKADKLAADQSQRLADLEQQLRQLDAARQQMTADPQLAQQMLDDQTAGVEGMAAARELEALATDLDARGRQLQAIEEQAAEMAEQSPTAAGKQLDAISQAQAELDEKALTVIDQLKDLLGLKPEDDEEPLAPWVPPGEKFESTPVEEDVPDAVKKDKDKASKNDGDTKDADASKPDEDENWWDKPADVPAVGGPRGEESERYKDRHRPVPEEMTDEDSGAAGGKPKPPEPTPRQQLTAHQAQMQQALTENADEARRQGAAAREIAQRLGAKAPQSVADVARDKSGAAARQALADPATQEALKMAQRMQAGLQAPQSASHGPRPGQGKSPPQPARSGGGSSTGTVSVQPGSIVPGPAPLGSDPRERAKFYQLPPRLREPLLEGMQERGPEGYQPLIDAYFRELSKEIKVIAWLLKILGISDEVAGNFSQAELRWGHGELAAIGLALLIPAAWFIVRRQRRNLPHIAPRARNALSACRIGVLLLLVMVLGAPYLHTDESLDLKPVVALVVDDSASMNLPAGPYDPVEARALGKVVDTHRPPGGAASQNTASQNTASQNPAPQNTASDDAADLAWRKRLNAMSRADLLAAVLRAARTTVLEPLPEKFELKVYRVARHVRPTTLPALLDEAQQPPPPEAETNETDLGQAIRQAVNEAQGRKIAGIVLMTDGRSTTWPDPVALTRSLVDLSPDSSPAPIFSIPVGSEHPAPDVAVVDISVPPEVAKDDTVSVAVTLSSQGFDGHKAVVELHDGDGPALSTQEVTLSGARRQAVLFTYNATQAGTRLLQATVQPLPDEAVGGNNTATATVRVGREPAKLLYLEGIARWDFRFLDHALRRDKAMTTTFVVESQLEADAVPANIMPEAAGLSADPAKWAEYHVVLLGDISPTLLPEAEQKALVAAVENDGLGLIVQCGNRHMPWDFTGGPLAAILPMTFDAAPAKQADAASSAGDANPAAVLHGLQAPAFAPFRMIVTPTGATHPAFAITGNASQDRGLWSQMPEFYWAAAGTRLKPGATRLADIEMAGGKEKLPILAEQVVGRGRVMIVGCDETFRWRRNVGDRIFYRFWGQALRHVARKQAADGQLSWLEVQPQSVEPGMPVTIDLYAVDESHQPLDQEAVSVAVSGTGVKETVRLERVGEPGHFRGGWTPQQLGMLNVEYASDKQKALSATLEVASSRRELAQPDVDRETLNTLAEISGGGMIELPQLTELPGRLAGEIVHQQRPYEDDLWDNWLTLLLLAGLYCTDVGIRRVLGLI